MKGRTAGATIGREKMEAPSLLEAGRVESARKASLGEERGQGSLCI